ncbi:ATP-binding protein [Castellaniella caeni]|uniref:ATP-binding protein n=1 Tax=Castellaniella caeni TaxID=266123 RepID=UPI000C9EFA5D|nr:ATP-binding protein [Castellaniella caeni]
MDGLKKRLNASLRFKLAFNLSLIVIIVAGIAGIFSFFSSLDEAHELQDDVLYQIAGLMDQQHLALPPGSAATHLEDSDDDSHIIIQRLGAATNTATGHHRQISIPAYLADGLHTLESQGEMYRVLITSQAAGERLAIAQETSFRDKIARESALRTLMPFLVLIPILLVMITRLVRTTFQPIAALSHEIDQRPVEDLHPISGTPLPAEVSPFVTAINRLLGRVERARETQQRFVADAAHELRSPMTALSLQAERLAEAEMSATARDRLATLQKGIYRGRNLLDQLLSLARVQSSTKEAASQVCVPALYRHVLEDLMPQAQAKQLDVGVTDAPDLYVAASELDLATLIRNLVDNAIRYTPPGGRVDLSARLAGDFVELCVADSGPGIAEHDRARVFDPFYRVLGSEQIGSGLGLAIVRTIASRLGARIRLEASDVQTHAGLKVTVSVPRTSRA